MNSKVKNPNIINTRDGYFVDGMIRNEKLEITHTFSNYRI